MSLSLLVCMSLYVYVPTARIFRRVYVLKFHRVHVTTVCMSRTCACPTVCVYIPCVYPSDCIFLCLYVYVHRYVCLTFVPSSVRFSRMYVHSVCTISPNRVYFQTCVCSSECMFFRTYCSAVSMFPVCMFPVCMAPRMYVPCIYVCSSYVCPFPAYTLHA